MIFELRNNCNNNDILGKFHDILTHEKNSILIMSVLYGW